MKNLLVNLGKQSRGTIIAIGFVVLSIVATADLMTGPRVALLLFYFIPVAMVAWFVGRGWGVVMTFIATCIWALMQWIDPSNNDRHTVIIWNGFMRGTLFLIT